MKIGYYVRDTLVKYEVLESLSIEKQAKIKELTELYYSIGYIDARTQIGPDQARRQSEKQRNKITSNACAVFAIEEQIKHLLKSDEVLKSEQEAKETKEKIQKKQRIEYRIRDIENYLSHKLNSSRMNPTKKEYAALKEELKTFDK